MGDEIPEENHLISFDGPYQVLIKLINAPQ